MLAQNIFIYNPQSLGGGQYTAAIYFQDPTVPQYVILGDYIQDTASNEYEIIAPTTIPVTEGATITVQYITTDTAPIEDTDYNSSIYTSGQVNVRPEMKVEGSLSNPSIYDGNNYEYTVLVGWLDPVQSAKAIVGDSIVDFGGKEFEITYIDPVNRFNSPCRIKEVEKEAQEPIAGEATMYRATPNYSYFQGTELEDPSRTVVFNRDKFLIDSKIKELADSIGGAGSGIAIEDDFTNSTGSPISALIPVTSIGGNIDGIDVSTEDEVMSIVGVTRTSIANGTQGPVVLVGLIKNVTITGNFDDIVYVDKTGALSITKPEIGVGSFVAGDFIIRVGKIVKNKDNPSNKDLLVRISIVGQL